MASNEKSEDEILGLGPSNANLNLVTDDTKDGEDISCIDEEMLLLSSPSPSPAREKSEKNGSSTSPLVSDSTVPKTTIEVNDDDDDEPEIIDDDDDDDDVEEITQSSENTDGDEVLEESDESVDSGDSASFMDGKINIFSCHGSLLLWNAEDAQMLREECRIVGKLVGCLPRAPRQNSHLGLPLQLMPEEAKLLVDIDAAVVVEEEEEGVTSRTMKVREAAFRNVRQTNYRIQQNLYKESRKEEVKQRMGDIIAGKKAKKRKLQTEHTEGDDETSSVQNKQTCDQENNTEASTSQSDGGKEKDEGCNEEKETGEDRDGTDTLTVDDILSTSAETSEKHSLVQIFTENPWKQTYRSDANWIFPGTEKEMLRYLVFKDLWGKGFYLTSGSKFGGDFLVYPGDPARFHSHYIAICKNQHEEMPCLDIITLGRLASNVRKTALLCALDRHGKVFYTSLQWTGIS